jgi:hypothetical protein
VCSLQGMLTYCLPCPTVYPGVSRCFLLQPLGFCMAS